MFASHLKPEGPVYEPLVHYPLAGAGPSAQFEAQFALLAEADGADDAGFDPADEYADPLNRRVQLTV